MTKPSKTSKRQGGLKLDTITDAEAALVTKSRKPPSKLPEQGEKDKQLDTSPPGSTTLADDNDETEDEHEGQQDEDER